MQPIEVGGWDYPAGVCLVPNAYLIHHDPDIYPDPYAFRPERFLDEPPGTYTWIPFGGGRRRCLGASFAMLEMKIVLRSVLAACEVRPAGDGAELARRRNITIRPARGARRPCCSSAPASRWRRELLRPGCARVPATGSSAPACRRPAGAELVDDVVRRLSVLGWTASAPGGGGVHARSGS